MEHMRKILSNIRLYIPELVPKPAPLIKNYGKCPYFQNFRLGTRDLVEKLNGDIVPSTVRSSLPRDSIGARSSEVKIYNFQWLMNKKLTCVLMWIGVIILIVGIIALQIAGFFYHKRQDILSIGVGCLSSGLCLLVVTWFTFLHAHLFIYDSCVDESNVGGNRINKFEEQIFDVENETELRDEHIQFKQSTNKSITGPISDC